MGAPAIVQTVVGALPATVVTIDCCLAGKEVRDINAAELAAENAGTTPAKTELVTAGVSEI